jgi:hypothetical protein
VGVRDAIREADALLPGEPVDDGRDPRWQAIIRVGEFVQSDPEPVWQFVRRWAGHPQEDLRDAIATCLLEHLLEYHFETYFSHVEKAALSDPLFGDTFRRCWQLGQAEEPGNTERFQLLIRRIKEQNP